MPWRASRFAARIATVMTTISGSEARRLSSPTRSSVPQTSSAVDARTALKPGAGMPSSVKKSVTLSRPCSFPQPVPMKITPSVSRARVGPRKDSRSAMARNRDCARETMLMGCSGKRRPLRLPLRARGRCQHDYAASRRGVTRRRSSLRRANSAAFPLRAPGRPARRKHRPGVRPARRAARRGPRRRRPRRGTRRTPRARPRSTSAAAPPRGRRLPRADRSDARAPAGAGQGSAEADISRTQPHPARAWRTVRETMTRPGPLRRPRPAPIRAAPGRRGRVAPGTQRTSGPAVRCRDAPTDERPRTASPPDGTLRRPAQRAPWERSRAARRPGGPRTCACRWRRAPRRAGRANPRTRPTDAPAREAGPRAAAASRRGSSQHLGLDLAGAAALLEQPLELGNVIVPFDQGGNAPETAERGPVQLPDGIDYRSVVRVQHVAAVVAVAGQVELADAVHWNSGQVSVGIEAVVARAHVDVVHVEEEAAVGLPRDPGQELPFGHGGRGVFDVAGDVLEEDLTAEHILDLPHARDHVRECFLGVRKRQQVVNVPAGVAAPAEVVRDVRWLDAVGQLAHALEQAVIERIDRTDGERDAVQDHRNVAAHLLEHRGGAPAEIG